MQLAAISTLMSDAPSGLWVSQTFSQTFSKIFFFILEVKTIQFFDSFIYLLFILGVHVFGLCATALITDIIQLSTGYPTPYFLTVCKPNYTHLNSSCDEISFILEDICSGSDTAIINAGR